MSAQQRAGVLVIALLLLVSIAIIGNILAMDWRMPPPAPGETASQAGLPMRQTDHLIGWAGTLFLINGAIVLIYFKTFGYKPLKKD